jgi:AbiV family abortive infection protein
MGSSSVWEANSETFVNGISLCLKKAKALSEDAMLLFKNGTKTDHAVVLYVYAVEEFGKALLLDDEYRANPNEATYDIDKELFVGKGAHSKKLQRVHRRLPDECLKLMQGSFDAESFDRESFSVDILADLETRAEALYVDWSPDIGIWKSVPPIDRNRLEKAIVLFQDELSKFSLQRVPEESGRDGSPTQ